MRATRTLLVLALPAVVVCLDGIPAAAQNEPIPVENSAAATRTSEPSRWEGGVGLLSAVPSGEFASQMEHSWGLTGSIDARLGHSVFRLGIETSFVRYGWTERTVALDQSIPEVPTALRADTVNDMWLLHARFRAARPNGRWRPYADGLVGFNDLVTTTRIPGGQDCYYYTPFTPPVCTDGTVTTHTNARDVVPSYGAGAGLMVGLSSSRRAPRLNIAVRYLSGGEGRYLTEGALRDEGGSAVLNFNRSRTNMVTVYVGLSVGR